MDDYFRKFFNLKYYLSIIINIDQSLIQGYATQVPELGKEICAIIEYDSDEAAVSACRHFNSDDVLGGMRVALLGPRIKRNLYGPWRFVFYIILIIIL